MKFVPGNRKSPLLCYMVPIHGTTHHPTSDIGQGIRQVAMPTDVTYAFCSLSYAFEQCSNRVRQSHTIANEIAATCIASENGRQDKFYAAVVSTAIIFNRAVSQPLAKAESTIWVCFSFAAVKELARPLLLHRCCCRSPACFCAF